MQKNMQVKYEKGKGKQSAQPKHSLSHQHPLKYTKCLNHTYTFVRHNNQYQSSTEKKKKGKMQNVKGGDGTLFSILWPKRKRKPKMISHCLNVEKLPLNMSFSHHSQTGIVLWQGGMHSITSAKACFSLLVVQLMKNMYAK